MRCQNCGRELKNGARFCIACGAEHDANGQLVNAPQNNNFNNSNMMSGSETGFKQYVPDSQSYNDQNYSNGNDFYNESNPEYIEAPKKKISPIIIICPIIIVGAILFSIFGGKGNKKDTLPNENIVATESTIIETEAEPETEQETMLETEPKTETTESTTEKQNEIIATESLIVEEESISTPSIISTVSIVTIAETKIASSDDGYWDDDEEHFYINDVMQKDTWVDDYYVDSAGNKARNMWIPFYYTDNESDNKIGYYYVGEDGKKVVDDEIDGKYLDKSGSYFGEIE